MSEERALMIQSNPEVAKLNRVAGFDPVKLLWRAVKGRDLSAPQTQQLVLKYKKLWFRMACPNGRIHLIAHRLTDQMAIIEAEIYRDRRDEQPVANFISTRSVYDTPEGLYTQAAEYEAQDNVLTEAGFGIQLCDVCQTLGEEAYTPKISDQPGNRRETDVRPVQINADMETGKCVKPSVDTHLSPKVEREQVVSDGNLPSSATSEQIQDIVQDQVENHEDKVENLGNPNAHKSEPMLCSSVEPGVCETIEEQARNIPINEEVAVAAETSEGEPSGDDCNTAASDEAVRSGFTSEVATEIPTEEKRLGSIAEERAVAEPVMQPVNEACNRSSGMTLEEAKNVIVDFGISKGKTLEEIGSRRPAALRWFFTTCPNSSEELKAAARLVYDSYTQEKSA